MADTKASYPRIPESNWWALRDQFSKSLPPSITITYLKTLLQLTSDGAAQNLLPPLKRLGLIDDNNKPTARANDWRLDSSYSKACDEMLQDVYPEELRQLFDGPDVEKARVKPWFQSTASLGEGTADQSAAFYVLLQQKSPKTLAEYRQKKAQKGNVPIIKDPQVKPRKPVKQQPPPMAPKASESEQPATSKVDISSPQESPTMSLHIDFQIHISPEASPEQIDSIFASMAKHIGEMRKQ